MVQVMDAVLYFNEVELFCARYDLLKDVVDKFCVFESGTTFTGHPKPNDFWSDLARVGFAVDVERISYLRLDALPDPATAKADARYARECALVARIGADMGAQWFKEHLSRELMKRTFEQAADDDVVLISDVDEIPTPDAVCQTVKALQGAPQAIVSIPMRDFVGSIACDTGKPWEGTFAMCKRRAMGTPLSLVRSLDLSTGQRTFSGVVRGDLGGWHFSSFGGSDVVERKIKAWGHQELNRWDIRLFLGANIALGRDIFGRDIRGRHRALSGGDLLNPMAYFDASRWYHGFICGEAKGDLKAYLLRMCFVGVQIARRVLNRVGLLQA